MAFVLFSGWTYFVLARGTLIGHHQPVPRRERNASLKQGTHGDSMPAPVDTADGKVDAAALREALTALYREHGGNETALRREVLALFRQVVEESRATAERVLAADGKGTACAARLSDAQDELIRVIHDFAVTHVYRAQNPSAAER
ncbi:MAG: hypothetical protein ACR2PM_02400, partial [Hyphomicrobiales bacterium]